MKELTYVMVKPDYANNEAVIRMVRNKIMQAGFKIELEGFVQYNIDAARKHYAEHVEKPFYPNLEKYITSDRAFGMVVSGENCIDAIHDKTFMGSTKNPSEGTIRYNGFALMGYLDRDPEINGTQNVAHSSDAVTAAQKEIAIFIDLLKKEVKAEESKEI